ncbi:hypothetical protein EDB85DRAFT_1962479 [Lactarius pseudohatsudake]|nr:hypothetical protein EDB85DRAFT_1962479 [Lactarius pseudohatsudake]
MVYTLLSNRTQVRRTNSVLNHLAIYSINCGTLTLVFAISCVILVLLTSTSCALLSNIDSLNEARQVSKCVPIRAALLHLEPTLFLCVHVRPELPRSPSRDTRRTGRCYHVQSAQGTHGHHSPVRCASYDGNEHQRGYQSSTGLSFLRHVDLRLCHSFQHRKVPSYPCSSPSTRGLDGISG